MLKPPSKPKSVFVGKLTDGRRWEALKPRVGDIVVSNPPKCGTTWTQSILALLISGDPKVDAETSIKSPWIDFNIRDINEVMEILEAQDHRRQLKSHTPLNGIPVWPDLRYITVYRHPIDVFFSFRKHAQNLAEKISKVFFPVEYVSGNVSDGFRFFLESGNLDAVSLDSVVNHYLCTLTHEPSENLLRLHYADMLLDLSGTFDRIAAHVGITHPDDVMAQLIEEAQFDNMKANAHRFTPSAGRGSWKNDAAFFDSASSNKWVGRLTDEELAAYDARMQGLVSDQERRWLEFGNAGA